MLYYTKSKGRPILGLCNTANRESLREFETPSAPRRMEFRGGRAQPRRGFPEGAAGDAAKMTKEAGP